jgi:hypothetical protein
VASFSSSQGFQRWLAIRFVVRPIRYLAFPVDNRKKKSIQSGEGSDEQNGSEGKKKKKEKKNFVCMCFYLLQ